MPENPIMNFYKVYTEEGSLSQDSYGVLAESCSECQQALLDMVPGLEIQDIIKIELVCKAVVISRVLFE